MATIDLLREPEMTPNFSIVTASYNQGAFIGKCVESVKRQTRDVSVEHIILDNVSTDETVNVLESYRQNPGDVDLTLYVEKDDGQTSAINKGFTSAKGQYISWLNTDEYLHDGALEIVRKVFEENEDIDVVFGDSRFIDAEGKTISYRRAPGFSEAMLLYYGCYIPSCTTFIRKRVIDDGMILDPFYRVTMDFEFYVRLSKAGYKFKHVRELLCDFTWHGENISIKQNDRRLIERRKVRDIYSELKVPNALKTPFYASAEIYWKAYRFIWRRLHPSNYP